MSVKTMARLLSQVRVWIKDQSGQDLVEYALVVALIAFGATASMKSLANGVKNSFNNISTQLSTNV